MKEGFAGYLSNKSYNHEHFVLCPQLSHYSFGFLYKLSQFPLPLFQLDFTLISSRCQDSLTIKVQMLHFSTEMGASAPSFKSSRAQVPLAPYISGPGNLSHLLSTCLI